MAQDQQNQQNLNSIKSNSYNKGLIKDFNDSFVPEGVWTNAINAVTNSHLGEVGVIGNEPSNEFCVAVPYTIIGLIRRTTDTWVVFSTNNVLSEIGIFTESNCSYTKIVSDTCLGFNTHYLITGHIQYNFDCTYSVFWADGLNPDRTLNLDNVPYQITGYTGPANCPVPIYSTCLDCEAIRLNYLVNPPCITIKKSISPGNLLNGSYQAFVAYTVNGQRVTSYFTPSNIVGIWNHIGVAGGLEIFITDLDTRFEEYELVIVSTVNSQTVARKIGLYSTDQQAIAIDNYSEALPSVPLNLLPLVTPIYEKSDKMFHVNGYLLRSGVYSKYDFNYQPLANNIVTYWQEVRYPSDYYYKQTPVNASYMRDEQYAFFIRWIYNDGDKSASYHIPGRAAFLTDLATIPNSNQDVLFNKNKTWQVYNTATVTNNNVNITVPGGVVTREGLMGYWESTELYPNDSPDVWGNLCGEPIRHHKFPDNGLTHIHSQGGDYIYVLGARFDNIVHPLDNQGNPIPNIIGYEILRGSREGNKTIVAKGLLNNMREYKNVDGVAVLYQNYPYNDLRPDYFLSSQLFTSGQSPNDSGSPLTVYKRDHFSFHSPDTNFNKPFLSYNEVRLYTREFGNVSGKFSEPYGHPKHKLITNTAWNIALVVGVAIGINAVFGRKKIEETTAGSAAISTIAGAAGIPPNPYGPSMMGLYAGGSPIGISGGGYSIAGPGGVGAGYWAGVEHPKITREDGDFNALDPTLALPGYPGANSLGLKIARAIFMGAMQLLTASYWAGLGLDKAVTLIQQFLPYRQYAVQVDSHGFYSNYVSMTQSTDAGRMRRENNISGYISDQLQAFSLTYNINNLFRNDFVAINTKGQFQDVSAGNPALLDDSRKRIRDTGVGHARPWTGSYGAKTSAYYSALKNDYDNQYGQLNGIVQIPVTPCYYPTDYRRLNTTYSTDTVFGGDIYIGRYTEKNPFFYFNTWLYDMPNGTEINYPDYSNVIYPRYWANFTKIDSSALNVGSILNGPQGVLTPFLAASSYHHLDRGSNNSSLFLVIQAYFYLFNNGIRDFFVETEVNLAQRDYGDDISERHYDYQSFTDFARLFRTDIIKAGNYYKYDYSLSISRLLNSFVSYSAILPRTYDPTVAETCYSYFPTRVLYSLQQQSEQLRESWRIYLVNNYKTFENKISHFKPINRTGSLILFEDAEPTSITGVDQLQTGAGTKITIGDGGLFAQPFQSLVNSDDDYEYGSSQDTRAVINTPYGTFWMSRSNGKIMQYTGNSIVDISMNGMRMWFAKNLPTVLTTQFPNFFDKENPVIGVGCLAVYDNQFDILYFTKKDYKAFEGVKYDEARKEFYIEKQSGIDYIELGDPNYFENCSWTISYDPKTKMWLSFHDWHPTLVAPTNDHFYTINTDTFWKHNESCQSFCNYYGKDYAFEVEFPVNTGASITTIKNVEYTMEAHTYSQDCLDQYHVLNANFDYAMIYNTEQNSGLLKLNLKPQNPVQMLGYPVFNTDSVDILYSKEENKYRFNQFFDLTRDRGEFSGLQTRMFDTQQNGYKKTLNPFFIDYTKSPFERKKFRHYGNRVILGKTVSNNIKYNLKVFNTKETASPR